MAQRLDLDSYARTVPLTLVYETHATTIDNENGVATGWLPGELSEAGRQQARELGERRRDDGIVAIYVSDLGRALQTVAIAFTGSDIPVFVDGRLRECDYGELNGAQVHQLNGRRAEHVDVPWPGGESYRDVVARTRSLILDVRTQWGRKRVLWVGHSANRWALQHIVQGQDLADLVDVDFAWLPGWEFVIR